ncbi:hypothetical protein HNQ07_000157 [Deinococcus metalli]|uniref:Uncharacterized protein n=1 Tax=Deinococcus metalli TaxID=1141878 RepID=A0A7W8KBJ5_9DEIO|nr:hypothetical protein [Deinococcus metalli]MBB5374713.1 hypothetical protein [Deinococcus metalli]GHF34263.1 hypothetical protein GCM10017781_08860 [Deinococcus metalli]
MLAPELADVVAYHTPLSVIQREQGGAVTLLTPGVNVLALNATFLPDDPSGVDLDAVREWHEGQGVPVLVASTRAVPGAREVARVQVGRFTGGVPETGVAVEQVSRLHLAAWADVLARAYGTPGWADALARHLAPRLEGDRDAALLLAYRAGTPVGALLWRASAPGGAAHLWGTLDAGAAGPLLDAAAGLGGPLRTTVTDGHVPLDGAQTVIYSLLE